MRYPAALGLIPVRRLPLPNREHNRDSNTDAERRQPTNEHGDPDNIAGFIEDGVPHRSYSRIENWWPRTSDSECRMERWQHLSELLHFRYRCISGARQRRPFRRHPPALYSTWMLERLRTSARNL